MKLPKPNSEEVLLVKKGKYNTCLKSRSHVFVNAGWTITEYEKELPPVISPPEKHEQATTNSVESYKAILGSSDQELIDALTIGNIQEVASSFKMRGYKNLPRTELIEKVTKKLS